MSGTGKSKVYEAPVVRLLGTVAALTRLNSSGPNPDAVMMTPSGP